MAYLMNEYSILSYCFDEDRIEGLMERGAVDENFHIQAQADELYDYVRIDDINRLDERAGLELISMPDGGRYFAALTTQMPMLSPRER